ncbi:MAG: DUF308 domain-containing protein [Clostridiales bacterium]|jgi:uncharacterized membrane protein HdeD (DUF308 family)|nr:DUF308 domain-containing protein [Clostridiales bacterium]
MKKSFSSLKESKWYPLIIGILSIVLGIICLLNPSISMESIALVAGIVFLLFGILQVINGLRVRDNKALRICTIALGAILIVLAILDFANLKLIGKYLPTLAGLFMIVSAVTSLVSLYALMKNGCKNWWYGALPVLVLLVLGCIFLFKPGFVGETFGVFSGIALLVNGVSNLISFAQTKK